MGTMHGSTIDPQLAVELSELADGSISLFVILPIFQGMMVSDRRAATLAACELSIGEHLAELDGILGELLGCRDGTDGDLTTSLFQSLTALSKQPASAARDAAILHVVKHAQLCLLGCCGFALRLARTAGEERLVHALEESLARIGSLAGQFSVPDIGSDVGRARQLSFA